MSAEPETIVCELGTKILEDVKILLERAETPEEVNEVVSFIIMIEEKRKLGDLSEGLGDKYLIYNTYKSKQQINQEIRNTVKIQEGGGFGALFGLAVLAMAINNAVLGVPMRVQIEGTYNAETMSAHTEGFRKDPAFRSRQHYYPNAYGGRCGWLAVALTEEPSSLIQRISRLANIITTQEQLSRHRRDDIFGSYGRNLGHYSQPVLVGYKKTTHEPVYVEPETSFVYTIVNIKEGTSMREAGTSIQKFQKSHIKDLLDKAAMTDGYVEGEQVITFIMQFKRHYYLGMARRYEGSDLFAVMNVNNLKNLFTRSDPNHGVLDLNDKVLYMAEPGFFEGTSLINEENERSVEYTKNPLGDNMGYMGSFSKRNEYRKGHVEVDDFIAFEYEGGPLTPGPAYETFPILGSSMTTWDEFERLSIEAYKINNEFMDSRKDSEEINIGELMNPSQKEKNALASKHNLLTESGKAKAIRRNNLIEWRLKQGDTMEDIQAIYPELFSGGRKCSKRKTKTVKRKRTLKQKRNNKKNLKKTRTKGK